MRVDLNADLGETVDGVPTADDDALFAVISSANIACGGHAGDAASMRASVETAARHGVAVGAHPSYDDRANFGRVARSPEPAELRASVTAQLSALVAAGASRQEGHEWLRDASLRAWEAIRQRAAENPLVELLAADEQIGRYLSAAQVRALMNANDHVGTAGERAAAFARTVTQNLGL